MSEAARPLAEVVAELRRLEREATPGPWTLMDWSQDDGPDRDVITGWRPPSDESERRFWGPCHGDKVPVKIVDLRDSEGRPEDAEFIRESRNALPALLDALEAGRKREARALAALEYVLSTDMGNEWNGTDGHEEAAIKKARRIAADLRAAGVEPTDG